MRIRVCFEKSEYGRYLSHLDLMRTMERSLRRAKAPLAFSEGFNPHIKISFASALAVGVTGKREYFDLDLAQRVDVSEFEIKLNEIVPPAVSIRGVKEIGDRSRSLSAVVNTAVYGMSAELAATDASKLEEGMAKVLATKELLRKPRHKPGQRQGKVPAKEKDVRHLIRRLEVADADMDGPDEAYSIKAELLLAQDGQLRPAELWELVCEAGGIVLTQPPTITRLDLLIYQGDTGVSPMDYEY